jgi:hypothetical protein
MTLPILGCDMASCRHAADARSTDPSRVGAVLQARLEVEYEWPDEAHTRVVHPTTFRAAQGPEYIIDPSPDQLERAVKQLLETVQGRPRVRWIAEPHLRMVSEHPFGVIRQTGCKGSYHDATYRCTELSMAWIAFTDLKVVRLSAIRAGLHHCPRHGDILRLPEPGSRRTPRDVWQKVFPARARLLDEQRQARRRSRIQRLLAAFGPPGVDDRLSLRDPHLSACSPGGILLADDPRKPTVVQVIVRDPSTGLRHAITVPPRYAKPESKTYQQLGSDEARVRAAVAWTFRLTPDTYSPNIEA